MNDIHRNKRIDRAQLKVMFAVPFFAPGIAKLPVIWSDSCPTAETDGKAIWWNREWFDSLKDEVVVTVLCHEAAHCLLGHLWRIPDRNEMETWNQATDHCINNMLKEFGELETAKHRADPFPMPDGPICCDPAHKGKSEEALFAEMMRNRPPGGGGKQPQSGQGGKRGVSGQPRGKSGPSVKQGGNSQPPGGHKKFGEMRIPEGTPEQRKKDQTDWTATLMQSVAAAKQQGTVPGWMDRFVGDLLHPKVPWSELLRNSLREQVQDDYSWMKPNPYFDDSGFILPSLDSDRIGTVVFCIDTSGSIDRELLTQFKSEMQGALDDLKPAKLIEICADTTITREREYRAGDKILPDAPGGGGTSFVQALARCEDMDPVPKCVVYLTDLAGSFPDKEPAFSVIWVSYNASGTKAPFGDTIETQ